MRFAFVIAVCGGVIATYLATLATWSLAHDDTLAGPNRLARVVLAWLLPLVGPMFILRAAAELAPRSLPAAIFTWPVKWLWATTPPVGGDSGPPDSEAINYGAGHSTDHSHGHH
jgi:hypothetical protein